MRITDALVQLNEILKSHGNLNIVSRSQEDNYDPLRVVVKEADKYDETELVRSGDKYVELSF